MSTVAAIEPSLRQAEIERVKRKRPDNLDAYDLTLRALPQVFTLMPDGALKSLPLLERALVLEPDYPTALGSPPGATKSYSCAVGCATRTGAP